MEKIISLFKRDYEGTRLVYDEVVPGAEWVLAGEGTATRKWDGTCCMVRDRVLYKRYDAKKGKTPPPGFEPAQEPDPVTGHWPGWIKVSESDPADRWHIEAWQHTLKIYDGGIRDGTYELCGPKVQGNPENIPNHVLIPHGMDLLDAPRTFAEIKVYLSGVNVEGIVWHHLDGRMVKIKAKDFGIRRQGK